MRTANLLRLITSTPQWEWEWLDLLSQMEYVGCRKIARAVDYSEMSIDVLQHLAEEASHAYLLKGTAERLGLGTRSWKDGLFSESGWSYFSLLDQLVSDLQKEKQNAYPAVSWVVEQRVLKLYPEYLEQTVDPQVKKVLRQILAQEQRHAKQFMPEKLMSEEVRNQALSIERMLWDDLCMSVTRQIEESGACRDHDFGGTSAYLH